MLLILENYQLANSQLIFTHEYRQLIILNYNTQKLILILLLLFFNIIAMQELDVETIKVNPLHIKFQNQYVECCCDEEVRSNIFKKLEVTDGVFHVELMRDDECKIPWSHTTIIIIIYNIYIITDIVVLSAMLHIIIVPQTRHRSETNYCVFKLVIGNQAGTIVRALRIFFVRFCDKNENIIQ